MTNYEKQALDFLKSTNTKIIITKNGVVDRFPNDPKPSGFRQRYHVTLSREGKCYTFPFYGSIASYEKGESITAYDVLACLQKYELPGDVWDFADEYGYKIDSRSEYMRVNRIYSACKKEYNSLLDLFGVDLLEQMQEIN